MAGITVPREGDPGPAQGTAGLDRRMEELEAEEAEHHGVGPRAIYVWELPVRLTHWAIVISVIVLTITGVYLHGPFLPPSGPIADSTRMASMRFVHELSAIVFSLAFAIRFYWGFVGNRWASWRAIIPHKRAQLAAAREMGKYYLFMRPEPPPMTGHNLLAGIAYTVVSAMMLISIATGTLLFAEVLGSGPIALFQPLVALVPGGIQTVRFFHYLLMFLFIAFMIHHVYSAILVDIEERNGVMSSIFTGFKNIRAHSTLDDSADTPADREATGL